MPDVQLSDELVCKNGHRSSQKAAITGSRRQLWCAKCGADLHAEPKPTEKAGRGAPTKDDEPAQPLHVVGVP